MPASDPDRRSFVASSVALAGTLAAGAAGAQPKDADAPLIAYVGTFSSPLKDVPPTQVDLPPGNGRGIHIFNVDRATGALTAAGVHEMGTSPSHLAVNAAGTRLYSANETDRRGDQKDGTVTAFAIDPKDGSLKPLNTVTSGGAGPTYVSLHPSGKFLLVANYFGGAVAVLPVLADGKLGAATDVKVDTGKVGPTKAPNAPKGSFAFSGHDRTHAHQILADPSGKYVLHVDLGLDTIFVWKFDSTKGHARRQRPGFRDAAAGRRAAARPLPPQRQVAVLGAGGGLDRRAVRLRRRQGEADRPADDLDAAQGVRGEQLLLRDPGVGGRPVRVRRQPAARQHRRLRGRQHRRPDAGMRRVGRGATTRGASRSTRPAPSCTAATSGPTT